MAVPGRARPVRRPGRAAATATSGWTSGSGPRSRSPTTIWTSRPSCVRAHTGFSLRARRADNRPMERPGELGRTVPRTAFAVPLAFGLAGLALLVYGCVVQIHPLAIALAAASLVVVMVRFFLTF